MKAQIHPKWYPDAEVICACGHTFKVGSTLPKIEVEVCSKCHPFYTGQMKYVDTAGRVDAFQLRRARARKNVLSKAEKRRLKKEKKIQQELEKPESLEEIRRQEKDQIKNQEN